MPLLVSNRLDDQPLAIGRDAQISLESSRSTTRRRGIIPSMRRLLRWAFNGAAGVSAALFVAALVLWVRSYQVKSHVCRESHGMAFGISTRDGRLFLWKGIVYDPQGRLPSQPTRWSASGPGFGSVIFTPLAVKSVRGAGSGPGTLDFDSNGKLNLCSVVAAPFWSIAIGLMILPALLALRYWYRRTTTPSGHCPACGYDLRATPHRCPECGAVPKAKGAT